YRERLRQDFGLVTERALEAGAPQVVWIAQPTVDPIWSSVASPQESPERHGVLHETQRALADEDPARVSVADLAWWIDAAGLATDREFRPDGVHRSEEASLRVATDWLGPVLLDAAQAAPPRS